MMLTPEEIYHIAKLARLRITESEVEQYQHDLTSILEFDEQMNQVTEINSRDKFQTIAPATQDGLYLVPKVIE